MKNKLLFIFFAILTGSVSSQSGQVVLNEFLSSNSSINIDPDFNEYSDWIELYNLQNSSIDISNWFLTDNLDTPTKWQFPQGTSIAPGEFLLIWADGNNSVLIDYHTNFNLSNDGEEIGLFDSNEVLIDKIVYEKQITDISSGRQPDGGSNWHFFDVPTPGSSNNTSIFVKTKSPRFSLSPGFYTEPQLLEISTDDPEASIRYTIDGNEPTADSPLYSAPISIKSRAGEPNVFSEIRTNKDPHAWLPDWMPPEGEVFKATVIRARTFKTGFSPGEIITGTYFVDENIFQRYPTLPVISIISDYKHLFDFNTGIYVPGVYHRAGNSGSGNYFEDWEKPAHIELFEPGGNLGFSLDAGINVQGGTSPASPQKGLHVIARSEYGENKISYPIFKNDPSKAKTLTEFKRFIIRAWGSLIRGALFNDAYAHRLMAKKDLDIQAYQPAVVFINGEYWGLHALRESNKNSWYYQSHYGIERDNPGYDILIHSSRNGLPYPYVDEGDADHWNKMKGYLFTHDMRLPENYEYIKTQMDVDNFITYIGHCIYVGKWDWPNNNEASWRPRTPDGKWRWIQYDMETGFGVATSLGPAYAMLGPQLNMVEAVIRGVDIPGFGKYGPHPIMARLYNNPEFKASFIDWFSNRSNHEFMPDSMNSLLDKMAEELRPYMAEYKHRWPFIGDMNDDWENSLELLKVYNLMRPEFVRQHILEQYDTTFTGVNEMEDGIPQHYRLSQNFPNPFNPTTTIQYEIPGSTEYYAVPPQLHVKLCIYDILGREIKILINESQSPGQYQIEFNAGGLSSGIYFYRLQTSEFVKTKKMILLR